MSLTPQSIINERRSSQRKAAEAYGQDDIWKASQIVATFPPLTKAKTFSYPLNSKSPQLFIKFIASYGREALESEKRNQEFAFSTLLGTQQPASQQVRLIVCVPEVFYDFEDRGRYFVVMEFVPGITLNEALVPGADVLGRAGAEVVAELDKSNLYQYIATGIHLLSANAKVPPGAKPGPVGGGIIRHPFFKDSQARVPYRDVEMLEKHINKIIDHMYYYNDPSTTPTITLERELEFYYSDLNGSNFIFLGADGHIILYIIDFEEAGFLPHGFRCLAVERADRLASMRVAANILPFIEHEKGNLTMMSSVSGFLEGAVSYFALPLDGYPETEDVP
ncbi:hypothetical protein VP1G_10137 [Cytospora mali]|uniref:Aminoglycoside phosphotransferase domain-containing protein n=1 Tax=Cytospora mali TaxID=578113 RepID=A0A194VG70_CYTMA|nr:hypothetical protein VP1G_10137 [Valsa mali var. pyri (nom. inval.)]